MNGQRMIKGPPADDAPWFVRKSDFARLMGVSKPMVSKWVNESRLGAGLRADGMIDVIAACRSLGRPVPDRGAAGDTPTLQLSDVVPAGGDPLLAARTASARLKVVKEELDLAERQGRLVDAAAVKSTVEALSRELRERVMAVPADIADRCVGMPAGRIEFLIAESLEAALNAPERAPTEHGMAPGGAVEAGAEDSSS